MGRLVHLLVRLTAGATAILIVLLALAAARLSAGPVSLAFLTPSLARLMDGATAYRFHIGDAGVLWRDWQRGLLLHLTDVRITGASGAGNAQIADIAVAFSPRALAEGVIAPSSVAAYDGEITLPGETIDPGASETAGAGDGGSIGELLGGLRGPADIAQPLSFLLDASVRNVTLTIGSAAAAAWRLHVDRAELARDAANRLGGQAVLTLSRDATAAADATITLAPAAAGDNLSVQLEFSRLRPAAFAYAAAELAPLAAVDVTLQGTASAEIGEGGDVKQADVDLAGGEGALVLDEALARATGVAGPAQRLRVRTLALRASSTSSGETITVDNAEIRFAPGTTVYIPPVDHRFPLAGITASGNWAGGRLSVPRASVDLDGLRVAATAAVDSLADAPAGTITVTANDVRVDDFRRYWPPKAAPGAYRWCTQHLRDGIVPQVTARLAFVSRNGTSEVTALDARFDVERLTVDYLPPMPPVRETTGTATADLKSLRIVVTGGQAAGMTVRSGIILFPDLNRDIPSIDIDLGVAGPVRAAAELISHPPLEYAGKVGIVPERTSGETTTRLRLRFPLLADLDTEEIDIVAAVDLKDFGLADIADGIDITRGQAHLDIDNRGLRADGRLAVAGVEGDVTWVESFLAGAEPQTRLQFDAADVPVAKLREELRQMIALDAYLQGGAFAGKVGLVVSSNGQGRIETTLDLTRAALAIPEIGWHKPAGSAGTMEATVHTDGERLAAIPHAAVLAPGLDASGSLRMQADGRIERADIDRLISGRTHASGTLALLADGSWDIAVSGIALDLGPIIEAGGEDVQASGSSFADWPDLTLAADLETLWLGRIEPISRLQATAVHQSGMWPLAQLQGTLTDGSGVELTIAPEDGQARSLTVSAANAGEALRAFRVFPDMVGGRLETEGRFDDSDPAHPLTGRLRVSNFNIINTPILARLLSILALTGIRDALTGRGIAFSTLDMPFHSREGLLTIRDGRAFGSALGLTVSGDVDTRDDTLDVRGRLVPFYAVNSALGRLPLLGDVMTGGEKGGGVFSAGYRVSGSLADPSVSVNPVSVLFPGFLRWILETFQGGIGSGGATENGGGE